MVGTAHCTYQGQDKFVAVYATGFKLNKLGKDKVSQTCQGKTRRLSTIKRSSMIDLRATGVAVSAVAFGLSALFSL